MPSKKCPRCKILRVQCIAEKEVFVFRQVAHSLISEMLKNGCYKADKAEIEKIIQTTLEKNKEGNYVANKKFVGKNADFILEQSGINFEVQLI